MFKASTPEPPPEPVHVTLQSGDSIDEIYLIDARFNLVARGFGNLTATVQPGVYKVKIRAGEQVREEYLVLRPGESPVTKQFAEVPFASAAPLKGTAKTHEYHIAAAERESRKEHASLGTGSWIFIMARQWTSPTPPADVETPDHPATGLQLRAVRSGNVANAGEMAAEAAVDLMVASAADPRGDPWSACNVSVTPGTYILSLLLPSGRRIEQPIVAVAGWQTSVFLLQRVYPLETIARADLLDAAILMNRGCGFTCGRRDDRVVELARIGLTNRRRVVVKEIERILRAKFDDPLLGILGAHLALAQSRRDEEGVEGAREIVQIVVQTLRTLLGTNHPDVDALALLLGDSAPSRAAFDVPPMLRASWSLVLEGCARNPALVPAASLSEHVAEHLWGPSAWMVWEAPEAAANGFEDSWYDTNVAAAVRHALDSTRRQLERKRASTPDPVDPLTPPLTVGGVAKMAPVSAMPDAPGISATASVPGGILGAILSQVASGIMRLSHPSGYSAMAGALSGAAVGTDAGVGGGTASPPPPAPSTPEDAPPRGPRPEDLRKILGDDEAVKRLARVVGVPRGKLERYLNDWENRVMDRKE